MTEPNPLPRSYDEADGGPAFPIVERSYHPDGTPVCAEYAGLSIRDYFAGQALNGLLQSAHYGGELQRIFDPKREIANAGDDKESPQHYLSRLTYSLADAMIAARKMGGPCDANTK